MLIEFLRLLEGHLKTALSGRKGPVVISIPEDKKKLSRKPAAGKVNALMTLEQESYLINQMT